MGLFVLGQLIVVMYWVKPEVHAVTVALQDVLQLSQLLDDLSLLSVFPQASTLNEAVIVSNSCTGGTKTCCWRLGGPG